MLTDLRVRDLGVIADLSLRLEPGMTVLTGETGTGKTLLVHALQLVLGARAAPGLVRSGAEEAMVEARFAEGDAETVLARSVPATGRSRAWADGRMAPVAALAEAGVALVDIHGQHEQQTLLTAAAQRAALDQFAGVDLGPLAAARRRLAEIVRRLEDLGGDERDRARQADLLRYQVAEIEAAGISDLDEDATLALEEERLAHAGSLREAAARAVAALDGDETGATGQVGAAIEALGHAPAFAVAAGRLRGALTEIGDVAADLRRAAEEWEDDPVRLDVVQTRRRLLAELRRKYGDTLEDVTRFGKEASRALHELEHREEEAAVLEGRRAEAASAVAAIQKALRVQRDEAAPRLAHAVTSRLRTLAMPDAEISVTVGEEGAGDALQFLLAANRGEPAQPLSRVASGGELARAMLALRLVVEGGAPTMLFDEVDAGVGGAAALALAGALREVADRRQVLVVTHLPQVAAFADHQVAVRKTVAGRTVVTAEPLTPDQRVVEISRMLSGHPDSKTARAHAKELLASARRSTTATGDGD